VTINFTQFFDRFREICDTLIGIHTAQGTTIPALIDLLLAEYDTGTLEGNPITNGVVTAGRQNERQTQLASTLFQLANATLLEAVKADMPSAAISSTAAVTELIRQMRVGAETVKRNVVGGTPTPPDTSAPTLIVSTVDTQGRALEQIIAETLVGTGLVNGINLNLAGAISTASVQEHDWPTGSAISRNLAAVRPANGLVANPSFDNEDDRTNTPDDWIIHVGTVTTTVGVTDPEKQTVAISGTPTTGHYTLSWTLLDGSVVTTKPLVFNAAGADVQAALAAGLRPVLCVGETLQQNEAGRAAEVVSAQLRAALQGAHISSAENLVIAYEPVWAIGSGKAATPQPTDTLLRNVVRPTLAGLFGEDVARAVRVLYGGSVNAANAADFFAMPEIDGALVGGASLKAAEFLGIIQAAAK